MARFASCKPYQVKVYQGGPHFVARAVRKDEGTIGTLKASGNHEVKVYEAEVDEPGCGVGTRLYTALGKAACKAGKRLTSDNARTPASEGFWAKQLAKGRAECRGPGGGSRIVERADSGRAHHGKYKAAGDWRTCLQYILKCPVKTLSGARPRR